MKQGDGMRSFAGLARGNSNTAVTNAAPEAQGLAGWILALVRGWRSQREVQRKQLRLLETLPLGGKRQLMLVTCGGESFLVGGSLESVQTIVRLNAEVSLDGLAKNLDGTC
jgi:flagellar biogenesis protein FliO